MFNKKLIVLTIILVSLLSFSAVNAVDNAANDVVSVEETTVDVLEVATDEVVSVENDNASFASDDGGFDYLGASSDGTFTDLANEIANANGELNLTKNYIFSSSDSRYVNGILITKEIKINGKGFIINGNNKARVFNVSSNNVVIKNIEFTNCSVLSSGYGSAVYWKGSNGNLSDCNFINCKSLNYGGAVYWSGNWGSLFDCNFINCYSSKSTTNSGSKYESNSCGGAVYWNGYGGSLYYCSFENCYNLNSNRNSNSVTLKDTSSISSSSSSSSYSYGGAVYWNNAMGNLHDCDFINCYSSSSSNANTYTSNTWYSAGPSSSSSSSSSYSYNGVYWEGNGGNLFDCNFINSSSSSSSGSSYNSANKGHTYSYSYSYSFSYGGAVYWKGSNGNLSGCNFINPTSRLGFGSGSGSSTGYGQEEWYSNNAKGGAIYWYGDEGNILNCSFINCHVSKKDSAHGIYWDGNNGNLFNCIFINSCSNSNSNNKDTVYWDADNGNLFNCSFDGNYYDYQKYCGKTSSSSVHPVILIHTSTLEDNDAHIIIFESTQLVNNVSVVLYEVSDRKILYDEFNISSNDLTYSLNLNNLECGEYQIVIQYKGDDFYSSSSTNGLFKIGINSSYEIAITENLIEGDNATINLTFNDDVTGLVKLTLPNYSCINELINGKTSFNISNVPGGLNNYQIKYAGDNKYNPIYVNNTYNVLFKSNINLDLKNEYIFDENISLNYVLTPNCTGIVSIFVDNVFKANITVDEVFDLQDVNVGEYIITIIYNGDEHFVACNNSNILTVSKADPSIEINYSDLPGDVIFDVILDEKATGNVTLNINNNMYCKNIINGKANIIIPNLDAGNYSFKINYAGDNNYNAITSENKLTINKIPTTVSGTVEDIGFSQDAIINVKGSVDGIAVVKIDEKYIENINIIANTIAPVTFGNIPAGKHNVTITLKPNNINYEESTYNTTFSVSKKDSFIYLDVKNSVYGEDVIVNITASNDGKVILKIGDVTKEKNVFANTLTRINFGVLAADSYNVVASFDAGNNYKISNDEDNIIVSPADAKITEIQSNNNNYGEKTIIKVKTNVAGTLNIKLASVEKSFYVNANRLTSLDLGILDAGLQNIMVTLDAGSNYIKSTRNTEITVMPKSTTVKVNVENYIYGENVIVQVTASENGKVTVNVGDIVKNVDVNANKIALVDFGILDAKSYSVEATFNAGKNYMDSANSASLMVSPMQSKITEIHAQNPVYGENTVIQVKTNVDGALTVKVGGNTKVINVKANQLSSVDFGILDVNSYDVKLNLNAGSNYISTNDSIKIIISPKVVSLNLYTVDSVYGNDVIVKVSASENGKVTVNVGDIVKNVGVDANKLTSINFGNLNVGKYDVNANFDVGNNYVSSQKTSSISISPKTTVVTLNVKEYDVNEHVVVNVTASETGKVTIKLNNIIKNLDVMANRLTSVDFGVLDIGSYVVVASLTAGHNYIDSTNSTNIKVLSKLKEEDVNISLPEIKANEENNIAVNLPSDATGTVTLIIGDNDYVFDVNNGVANIKVPKLSDGNYNYVIHYSGDNKYSSFEDSGNINVVKPTPEIVIPPLDNPSNDGSVLINLPGDATGTVTLVINNKAYSFPVINGAAKIYMPELADGNYPYTITYSGDSKYSAFTTENNLNVINPVITATPTKVTYATGKYFKITVYGTDGELANGVNVIVTANGKPFKTLTTNADGVAKFKITQKPGTYNLNITALGKTLEKKLTVKHLVTLKSVTVKKSAKNLVLTATLSKVNKKYLKYKKVTFKFNGKKYTSKTNKKGVAKITIKSSVLKKLKVGKKVTYQATYLKDTVKKTTKIKK